MNITSRQCCLPTQVQRGGCPAQVMPTYQVSYDDGGRRNVIHEYTLMKLQHLSKNGIPKSELCLDNIHHELNIHSLQLQGSGASNILLSKVSFECCIEEESGKKVYEFITFDLKIPSTNASGEFVFSYEMVEALYGSKAKLYRVLKRIYEIGQKTANPDNHKHGHHPGFDPNNPKKDQYIRHTEQLLVAYLATPEAAEMLCNRLRSEIRGKFPFAKEVKLYNMTLHMHSTKTCCAPCEYSLIGLMNRKGFSYFPSKPGRHFGLLHNLLHRTVEPNESLSFSLPQSKPFRLITTVTADDPDQSHQAQPKQKVKSLKFDESPPFFPIDVNEDKSSKRIFFSKFNVGYDPRRLADQTDLTDMTVGISGSKATKGSPSTIDKVKSIREKEMTPIKLNFVEI